MVCAAVGEQRRDRSVSWGCWRRKIFSKSDPGEAGAGGDGGVCVRVYVRVHWVNRGDGSWELVNTSRFTGRIPRIIVYQHLCQARLYPFDHRFLPQSL